MCDQFCFEGGRGGRVEGEVVGAVGGGFVEEDAGAGGEGGVVDLAHRLLLGGFGVMGAGEESFVVGWCVGC